MDSLQSKLVQLWTPQNFFWYVVVGNLMVELFDIYLQYRQHRIYRTQKKLPTELVPYVDVTDFEKARLYNLDKSNFGFVTKLWNIMQKNVFLFIFLTAKIWYLSSGLTVKYWGAKNEIASTIIFSLIQSTLGTLLSLPFSLYSNFVIEERHGFNKYTLRFYFWDCLKKFVLMQPIIAVLIGAATYIMIRFKDDFFLWLWLFSTTVMFLMMIIYPSLIAPLFDKYTPLEEGSLRSRIQELAQQLGFPLKNIFVVDGSKRSSHSNAYFFGIFKTKQIVLFDTLFEPDSTYMVNKRKAEEETKKEDQTDESQTKEADGKDKKKPTGCKESEIVAIICHELGHWYYSHLYKNVAISLINLLVIFKISSLFFYDSVVYEAFGFASNDRPSYIGLNIIIENIFLLYFEMFGFIMSFMSRRFEFQADGFAKKHNYRTELINGLTKLNKDNLSFPVYDWLYSALTHSHPPILERIEALKRIEREKDD